MKKKTRINGKWKMKNEKWKIKNGYKKARDLSYNISLAMITQIKCK